MNSTLRETIQELRRVLFDADRSSADVRDAAYEVVDAWDAMQHSTPTQATAEYLTRLLSNMDGNMAETCRHTIADDRGVVPKFKRELLALNNQVRRFLRTEDVQQYTRKLHDRDRESVADGHELLNELRNMEGGE